MRSNKVNIGKLSQSDKVLSKTGMSDDEIRNALLSQFSRLNDIPWKFTGFGNSITEQTNGFIKWFSYESSGSVLFLNNAGIGGNTTQQMLDRLGDTDGATLVTVMESTNDASQLVTPYQHGINTKAILWELIKKGQTPLMVLAPPKDSASETLSISEMNIYDWLSAQELGVKCFNPWDQFSAGEGAWVSGSSSDGMHPETDTAKSAGLTLWNQYDNNSFFSMLNRNNNYGDVSNPLMLNDSNTDNIPDNFSLIGGGSAATATLGETSLGIGNTFGWTPTEFNYIQSNSFSVESGVEHLFLCRFKSEYITQGDSNVEVYLKEVNTGIRHYVIDDGREEFGEITISRYYTPTDTSVELFVSASGTSGTFEVTVSIAQVTNINLSEFVIPSGAEYTVNGETRYLP